MSRWNINDYCSMLSPMSFLQKRGCLLAKSFDRILWQGLAMSYSNHAGYETRAYILDDERPV